MEIHPPDRPIHGAKDFVLHLTTITIGILIALSFEGVVQWSDHRALVREAKARLAEELADNTREVNDWLGKLPALKASQDRAIRFIDDLRRPKQMKGSFSLDTSYEMMSLASTSWSTAQATGALAYMPYADAQKYATAYSLQAKIEQMQDYVLRTHITGIMAPDDPMKASTSELDAWKQNTVAVGRYLDIERQLAEQLLKEYEKLNGARQAEDGRR